MPDDTQKDLIIEGENKAFGRDAEMDRLVAEVGLPERREVRMSGDAPVTAVMPQAGIATALAGSREASTSLDDLPSTPQREPRTISVSDVVPLHTLKDDMSGIVESNRMSVVRAAAIEQDKRAKAERASASPEVQRSISRSRNTLGILVIVAILVGIGGAALFGVYTVMQGRATISTSDAANMPILFAENTADFALDGRASAQAKALLAQSIGEIDASIGSITRIRPTVAATSSGAATARSATLAETFAALGIHAPDEVLRALSDDFFFGFHAIDRNVPVFVIPVASYSRAFAGMLVWEPTINADLAPIFSPVTTVVRDASGVRLDRVFEDVVMNNYDVRVLRDDAGAVVLYYSFPNPQLLIIAESPYSFGEILGRLQAGRRL